MLTIATGFQRDRQAVLTADLGNTHKNVGRIGVIHTHRSGVVGVYYFTTPLRDDNLHLPGKHLPPIARLAL